MAKTRADSMKPLDYASDEDMLQMPMPQAMQVEGGNIYQ